VAAFAPGAPCWVDLASPDVAASTRFYGRLFGWEAQPPQDPAAGGYALLLHRGQEVAGVGPLTREGQLPSWTVYVGVADADAIARRADESGGSTLTAPMDVLDQGRTSVLADPVGVVFGLWQPKAFAGATLVGEPGSFCWSELATRDLEGAKLFYGKLFGWVAEPRQLGTSSYTEWKLEGRAVAGMIQMNEQWPEEMPAYWMVSFAVDDCDAAATKADDLGGTVMVPPTDSPVGPFAVIRDPHGAAFTIVRLRASSG
jgi:predicted enzyme related to lactoylglutathione lyase